MTSCKLPDLMTYLVTCCVNGGGCLKLAEEIKHSPLFRHPGHVKGPLYADMHHESVLQIHCQHIVCFVSIKFFFW